MYAELALRFLRFWIGWMIAFGMSLRKLSADLDNFVRFSAGSFSGLAVKVGRR